MSKPLHQISPELYIEMARNTAKAIKNNSIGTVFLLDTSARLAYMGINRVFRKDYPDSPKPLIYFINPRAKVLADDYRAGTLSTRKALENKMTETYPGLSKNKKEHILVMDVCMHSGETAKTVIRGLHRTGFTNLYFGLFQPLSSCGPMDNLQLIPSFEALRGVTLGCFPFGLDNSVYKVESLCSIPFDLLEGRILREQISGFLEKRGYPL